MYTQAKLGRRKLQGGLCIIVYLLRAASVQFHKPLFTASRLLRTSLHACTLLRVHMRCMPRRA